MALASKQFRGPIRKFFLTYLFAIFYLSPDLAKFPRSTWSGFCKKNFSRTSPIENKELATPRSSDMFDWTQLCFIQFPGRIANEQQFTFDDRVEAAEFLVATVDLPQEHWIRFIRSLMKPVLSSYCLLGWAFNQVVFNKDLGNVVYVFCVRSITHPFSCTTGGCFFARYELSLC